MTYDGCLFMLATVFDVCSSYHIAHGLCPVPTCAKLCTLEDYCYFGAATAIYCPYLPWDDANTNGSIALHIRAQCQASYAYFWGHEIYPPFNTTITGPRPPKLNQSSSAINEMNSAPSVTLIVVLTAGCMFLCTLGACCLFRRNAMNKNRGRDRENVSLFHRALSSIQSGMVDPTGGGGRGGSGNGTRDDPSFASAPSSTHGTFDTLLLLLLLLPILLLYPLDYVP